MPGHWVPSFSISHPNAVANSINFIDSAYGLAFIDSGTLATQVYRTTDGGHSWELWGSTDSGFHMFSGGTHPLQMLSKRDIYYAGTASDFWISNDSGKTFHYTPCPWNSTTAAASMFTPAFGISVVGYQNPALQVYETRDSGISFQPRSSFASSNSVSDAIFFDSSFWLVALHEKTILRTRDGGLTWDTVLNTPQVSFYNEAITSPDRSKVYVTGGLYNGKNYSASFFESTDTGNTWRADSSIYGNRIARMASPAPGKVWALVRTGLQSEADSLFYSPDDGTTWVKDSVTFIGKSLLDIVWPDSNHGYLWVQNGDTVFVYRYVNDLTGVLERPNDQQQLSITCYPNPALSILHIESSVGPMTISDPLGRSYEVKQSGNTLDVSALPSGVYFVSDGHTRAKFVKE
jgi:photosystem II stability/assembly factor-like uncharacterized protein